LLEIIENLKFLEFFMKIIEADLILIEYNVEL